MSIIICLTRCYPCMFGQCPGGWHTWADGEDVLHGFITRHVDVRRQKCGCACTDGPAAVNDADPPLDVVVDGLSDPCPVCGSSGACAWDAEGRALIHTLDEDDA